MQKLLVLCYLCLSMNLAAGLGGTSFYCSKVIALEHACVACSIPLISEMLINGVGITALS